LFVKGYLASKRKLGTATNYRCARGVQIMQSSVYIETTILSYDDIISLDKQKRPPYTSADERQ